MRQRLQLSSKHEDSRGLSTVLLWCNSHTQFTPLRWTTSRFPVHSQSCVTVTSTINIGALPSPQKEALRGLAVVSGPCSPAPPQREPSPGLELQNNAGDKRGRGMRVSLLLLGGSTRLSRLRVRLALGVWVSFMRPRMCLSIPRLSSVCVCLVGWILWMLLLHLSRRPRGFCFLFCWCTGHVNYFWMLDKVCIPRMDPTCSQDTVLRLGCQTRFPISWSVFLRHAVCSLLLWCLCFDIRVLLALRSVPPLIFWESLWRMGINSCLIVW